MAEDQPIFKVGDLFDDYAKIQENIDLIKNNQKHVFSTLNSTTLDKLRKTNRIGKGYNKRLIYDDKYFKCCKNPKPADLTKFLKNNPGYVAMLIYGQ